MNLLDNNEVFVDLKVLEHGIEFYGTPNEPLHTPSYAKGGDAAVDLCAMDEAIIRPGEVKAIRTGLAIHIRSPNVCAVVLPRSGLGSRNGIILANTVGLIDNGYQGELTCFIWNRNQKQFDDKQDNATRIVITKGMKFAQMMFMPFLTARFNRVSEFAEATDRAEGGFGSTGT